MIFNKPVGNGRKYWYKAWFFIALSNHRGLYKVYIHMISVTSLVD